MPQGVWLKFGVGVGEERENFFFPSSPFKIFLGSVRSQAETGNHLGMDVLADLRQGIEGQRRSKSGKQLERTTPAGRTGAPG
jgi:hypothetical protein